MPETWSQGRSVASWSYDLLEAPADLVRWLRETTLAVVDLLPGFAVPTAVAPVTESQGDRPEPVELTPEDPVAGVQAVVDAYDDLVAVRLTLAPLLTLAPGAAPEPWSHGASLALELEFDGSEHAAPYLHIHLSLNLDIYVERTYAEGRDNRVLARENSPRLTAFLQGLQRRLGAIVSDVDAISYPEQITADGFRSEDRGP